jgi:hypothetical protein
LNGEARRSESIEVRFPEKASRNFRLAFFNIIEFISFGVEAGLPPYFCFW